MIEGLNLTDEEKISFVTAKLKGNGDLGGGMVVFFNEKKGGAFGRTSAKVEWSAKSAIRKETYLGFRDAELLKGSIKKGYLCLTPDVETYYVSDILWNHKGGEHFITIKLVNSA